MMALLALLPFAFGLVVGLGLTGYWRLDQTDDSGWFRPLLWTAALVGAHLVLMSEALSLLEALNRLTLAIVWGLPLIILLSLPGFRALIKPGWLYWRENLTKVQGWSWQSKALLAVLAIESTVLLAVALKAAPNTADSLLYHMSRVAHWRQNQSLQHYPAVYHHQLWSPIFSEVAILNLFVLWGSDRLANLVQFLSMAGSLVAIAGMAHLLGAGRRTQLLAAIIGFSAPMAILQATSTQNDYVVGLWSITTLLFLSLLIKSGLKPLDWLSLGAAVGLGMLSKVTFYPYLGLLLLAGFILAWRNGRRWQSLLAWGTLAAGLAVLLNLGFWSRNISVYGTPLGARDMLASNTDLSLDPRAPIANGLQHLALNYVTPWPEANEALTNNLNQTAQILGQSEDRLEVLWGWNHEDLAGNPIHIALILLSIALSFLPGPETRSQRWYAAGLLLSFLGFAWAVDAGVHRVRYQVPWLLMGAPLAAIVINHRLGRRPLRYIASFFLLLALPYILFNQTRPVIGWQPRTRTASVFTTSREVSLFANATRARQPFANAAEAATADGCQRVGLSIDAIDIEYTFWWLLERNEPEVEIRVVRPLPELKPLQTEGFSPCAVICTNCQGDQFNGLQRSAAFGPVDVYR